ncbi:MAG: nucleotide sugar dehydrogenase, partial [Proteobacteria bacterium]|nr:nucleotide sugar dehydrogenase [Pseudomonadota bacterium]
MNTEQTTIAVIGLGYVGLPLAVEFARHHKTYAYDINSIRIADLKKHKDVTLEVSAEQLQQATNLELTDNIELLQTANIYIITVPTPVDKNNQPDLTPLKTASAEVATLLKKGDIVVYESTVYPGATEKECATILAKVSGLKLNVDFFIGYSPERINPGDKQNTLKTITKVVAASTPAVAKRLKKLYEQIIEAGVYVASSIKVAEAAKAIENTQRDVNIAFMNELSIMFSQMDIDVLDVIETASTKWNFLKFTPGLVG